MLGRSVIISELFMPGRYFGRRAEVLSKIQDYFIIMHCHLKYSNLSPIDWRLSRIRFSG